MRSDPDAGEESNGRSDRALLEALREGDSEAYATLWERHHPAALRAARQYDHSTEAEDIAQEAFARVLDAVRQGNGPQESFRAYLLRAVSNVAQNAARSRRRTMVSEDAGVLDSPVLYDDPAIAELEQHFIAQAYQRLNRPQRELLWYIEVEQLRTKQAAEYLGMTENTAAKAAGRARESLKREYLALHVESHGETPGCGDALGRMARYVRGSLSVAQRRKVDKHIGDCAHCAFALAELTEIGRGLQVVVAPLVVGTVATAAGYLATTTGDKAIAIAIGAGTTTGGSGGTAAVGGAGSSSPPTGTNNITRVAAMTAAAVLAVSGVSLAAVLIATDSDDPAAEQAVEPPSNGGGGSGGGSNSGSGGSGNGGGDSEPDRQQSPSEPTSPDQRGPERPEPDPPPTERKPSPEPEPTTPSPTSSPTRQPDPTPTRSTPPSPTPTPTPTLPTPTRSPGPPENPNVQVHRLTGEAWESEDGVAYAAIRGDNLEADDEVTLRVQISLLTSTSEPTGTIGSAPPLPHDDTWDCTGTTQLGYTCTTQADSDGTVTAAVQITDPGFPFSGSGRLTVQLSSDAGNSSDEMTME